MLDKLVEAVLIEYPNLYYPGGFGIPKETTKRSKVNIPTDVELKKQRQQFFDNIEEIECVVKLLQNVEKIKTFNKRRSSHSLKHLAEERIPKRYVSNGSFIIGAVLAGFKLKIDEPDAYFNISEKSLKQVCINMPH